MTRQVFPVHEPVRGCLLWPGSISRTGYGRRMFQGKVRLAHRVAFYEEHGYWPGELDHECNVRNCVNPDHLREVTHAENVRRSSKAKLSAEQVEEIKQRHDPSVHGSRIGLMREFGIGSSQFHRIVTGQAWQ